jgi:hypothetical protein
MESSKNLTNNRLTYNGQWAMGGLFLIRKRAAPPLALFGAEETKGLWFILL